MNYSDYSISKDGARAYSITLPCFSDDEQFYNAIRMNRFYAGVMGELYRFAEKVCETQERRTAYRCTYSVYECDSGEQVDLMLSLSRLGKKTLRKTVSHVWKNGHIVSEHINY